MKKFIFSLQVLLNVNRSLEKEQKNELSIINNEIKKMSYDRELLVVEITENNKEYMLLIEEKVEINQIKNRNEYIKYLDKKLYSLDEDLVKKEGEKEKLLAIVVKTMTKRKSLENLKEKQYKKYLAEAIRKDEVVVEDFASYNYIKLNQWGVELEQFSH